MVESVHSAEALARRPSAQQLHLAPQRQVLALVARLPFHGELEEKIAVFGKNGTVGIVLLKGFSGAFYLLDRPPTFGDPRLMQAFGKASAPGEDIQTFQRTRSGHQRLQDAGGIVEWRFLVRSRISIFGHRRRRGRFSFPFPALSSFASLLSAAVGAGSFADSDGQSRHGLDLFRLRVVDAGKVESVVRPQ